MFSLFLCGLSKKTTTALLLIFTSFVLVRINIPQEFIPFLSVGLIYAVLASLSLFLF